MNKHRAIFAATLLLFTSLTYYGSVSTAGSTFEHKINATFVTLLPSGLAVVSLLSVFYFRGKPIIRNYSILLLSVACVMLVVSTSYRKSASIFGQRCHHRPQPPRFVIPGGRYQMHQTLKRQFSLLAGLILVKRTTISTSSKIEAKAWKTQDEKRL